MDTVGPAIDLRRIDVDPPCEPMRDARAKPATEEVRHQRSGGRCERAYQHDLGELKQVAARSVAVERDDDVRRCGKWDTRLLDRHDEEEEDVLMLEDDEKEQANRVTDHGGQ